MRFFLIALLTCLIFSTVGAQDCEIDNLVVEQQGCVNGSFLVEIDFDVVNPESNMFGVVGNATDYGFFSYGDLPITLGPLDGDGETEWEFIVYDMEEPNCQAVFEIGIVTCCEIHNVAVDPLDCDNSETFSAVLNFSTTNTMGLGFNVFDVNDNALGFFLYADLPVTVSGIISSGFGEDFITICDNDDPNCCTIVEINGPDCDPDDCEIYDLTATLTECDREEVYVILDFQFENIGNDFTVIGNGNNYGQFEYEDLPIQLGPFPGDGSVLEFIVVDDENPGCTDFVVIETPVCPEACGFRDVVIEPVSCIGDTIYTIDLEFIPVSTNDVGYSLIAYGDTLGSFSYDSLPLIGLEYPASGDFFDTLIICDNDDFECCDTVMFQALLCADCVIYNMTATTSECDDNDQFTVDIDFEFQNTGDNGFQIGGNGTTYGTFNYDDLPITLGPLDGDNVTFWEFAVFDLDNPFCIQGVELGPINCINPCEIGDLDVEVLECTGDGFYRLVLDFDYANTDSAGFFLFTGGVLFENYGYDELPLVIDSFPASGNNNDVIRVEDAADEACSAIAEFDSPDCFLTCSIRDIVVGPLECTSDSTFSALVTFLFENLETDFVDIWSDGEYLGFFNVNSLPLEVDGFRSSFFDVPIEICANDNELCCATRTFQGLECDTTCTIEDLNVDLSECIDDGTYDLTVNFVPDGLTMDTVQVTIDGESEGHFAVSSLPLTFTGLSGTGESVSVIVCDSENDDCCESLSYDAPLCAIDSCDIRDVVLDEFNCQDDGTYNVLVSFIYEGLISDFVNISIDGESLGAYPVDSLPLLIQGLPGTGDMSSIVICDNDNPECCATLEFEAPECPIVCDVLNVGVENIECLGNGTFTMDVVFEAQGFENDQVDVFYDGDLVGTGPANEGSFNVTGLEGNGGDIQIVVCENDNDGCCGSFILQTPVCEGCDITFIEVTENECTSDTTFSAWIDYGLVGIDTAGVTVYADGQFIGSFPAITPLLVNNLPANGSSVLVELCGQDTTRSLSCCAQAEVVSLFCLEPGCPIVSVNAETTQCDTADQFNVILTAVIDGQPGGGFIVAGNGTTYGSFGYDELPLTLGPLDGDGETEWEFILIDLNDPSCSGAVDVGIVNCDPTGIFTPQRDIQNLQIRYRDGYAFFISPDSDLLMEVWSMSGELLAQRPIVSKGEIVDLTLSGQNAGVFVVHLRNSEGNYRGKYVLMSR